MLEKTGLKIRVQIKGVCLGLITSVYNETGQEAIAHSILYFLHSFRDHFSWRTMTYRNDHNNYSEDKPGSSYNSEL